MANFTTLNDLKKGKKASRTPANTKGIKKTPAGKKRARKASGLPDNVKTLASLKAVKTKIQSQDDDDDDGDAEVEDDDDDDDDKYKEIETHGWQTLIELESDDDLGKPTDDISGEEMSGSDGEEIIDGEFVKTKKGLSFEEQAKSARADKARFQFFDQKHRIIQKAILEDAEMNAANDYLARDDEIKRVLDWDKADHGARYAMKLVKSGGDYKQIKGTAMFQASNERVRYEALDPSEITKDEFMVVAKKYGKFKGAGTQPENGDDGAEVDDEDDSDGEGEM